MPVPSSIADLSTTAASNSPTGSEARSSADDYLRTISAFLRQIVTAGSDIASASTITPPSTGSSFTITGTTTITAIGSANSWDGRLVLFRFAGALQLTHSANLNLIGSANVTTAAGDVALFRQRTSGTWDCVMYTRGDGKASLADGTAAAPSLTFTSDPDTGLYRKGANRIGIANGGADSWEVDGSGRLLNVGNAQPMFFAERTSDQTSGAIVIFNSEVTDQGGVYDSTTGVFTAPVAGVYLFSFVIGVLNSGTVVNVIVGLSVNGATTNLRGSSAQNVPGGGTLVRVSGSLIMRLASGDTVSVRASSDFTTTLRMSADVSFRASFCGTLLG